ncbi:MAG: hypothetical protein UX85_C0003G0189 [Candidatus Beckwithbacteria bacterium GW2011_GWB1_47_15]|uniref:Uncharacterized protein n=1 Tax=Candidatus Beckwithbacteria bacterium GW2011_GWB1_47_15 TaxID=1618371 RepID=A0A0G1UUZ4_9BACT|nr:MAG: hypothetical protein UY43_C0001G0271 [Candidatus Beckwithbacteria bacterium GW2011_GWC1_49_16]KKU35192.1 MAG: hypothetical protein UX50_C0005G0015 [Candidatus Beckwithbacteria bacterium GW2011_GWA1_46_30]KKU61530.1 MAG: hypothetical protein UX85_C0003G0189 [Candidatus Beckwithbacteria bacterium GW2011_GWB1_47_15]KKU71734.1 MAG: hypothetical protein UX97_C0004G0057 [Candidatus Beckwithbacteria bacterium GW2011_GWA2_47_25]KKW03832.1 MAG: hypothetical protein UY37_C0004G0125 [Candidatus Be
MTPTVFQVDFKTKTISCQEKGSGKSYNAKQLYSFLMDLFDEPENMRYDIPIKAQAKDEFKLINGWTIDKASRKFLKGHISQG